MRQRINPVLPPPRRPRLYGWDQDVTYTGKMGGKWVGNAEHAGQTRYQADKPGTRGATESDDDARKDLVRKELEGISSKQLEEIKDKVAERKGRATPQERLGKQIEEDEKSVEIVRSIVALRAGVDAKWKAVHKFGKGLEKAQKALLKADESGSSEDADAAAREFMRLIDEQKPLLKEANEAEVALRSKVAEVLALKKHAEIILRDDDGTVTKGLRVKALDARDWLASMTHSRYALNISVKQTEPGVREHATRYDIVVNEDTSVGTIVHEICHHMEERVGIRKALDVFLEERCGDEPYQKLNDVAGKGWDDYEMGRKDDFEKVFGKRDAWYVGKTYPQGQSELLSMTVQMLYEDPVRLATKDPELCAFVIGLLHGRIKM